VNVPGVPTIEFAGTVSLPFLSAVRGVGVALAVALVWCDSTIWPPWFRQLTVCEYVTDRFSVAFALPTPAIWNEAVGQLTVVPLTEQNGEGADVPPAKCAPEGAFAKLVVTTSAAEAAEAIRSSADSASAAIVHIRFMLFASPLVKY
jgi:hypothetical protein